ncbi:MAG: dTDP-4-dehydrorhamnose 3,5-epimerase [Lachnospiraceae bacterium]|nr:dTDP-4-dehydrorhamnose 3,5-epimerase [Lachnospiraceae bacterium]
MAIEKIEKDVNGIKGLAVITPKVFGDARGYFVETYNKRDFDEAYGEEVIFVQDNQSSSTKGVLRGLHFQINHPQDKLVRVLSGEVYDVAIDLREGSPTFGKHFGVILSAENNKQFFIPKNFAHGFLVLSETAEFAYKVTDFYHPNDEGGLMWNDADLGVEWPLAEYGLTEADIKLSDKDKVNPGFQEYCKGR